MTTGSTSLGRVGPPPFRRDRLAHAWVVLKALSDAGDAVWTIALAWTAVQLAEPATAGIVVAAGTIPRALVLLLGGVVADRHDARRIMVWANLARVVVLAATAIWVLATGPSITLLLVAAVAFGITDAIHEPAASTIGRQLVRPEDLPAYSGLSQTATRLGTMGGAAVGGFLVAHWGIQGAASVDAVTFVALVAFIALVLKPRFPLERAEREPVLHSVARGFSHLRRTPHTRTLVLSLLGLNLFVGPALGLGLPLLALARGWGAQTVGILEALVGLGAAVGALSMLKWRPRFPARTGFCFLAVQGVAVAALGADGVWVSGIACFVVGVTAGVASTLLGSVFAATVDGAYFGRMVSIQRLGDDVLMPVAMVGFGAFAGATSTGLALAVFGATMAVLMLWPLAQRRIRNLRVGTEPEPAS